MSDIRVAIKNLKMINFKCYEDFNISFCPKNNDGIYLLFGLFGPNGSGKTTVLDAITLAFSSFASYDSERLNIALRKYIRNFKETNIKEQSKTNFLVEADVCTDIGEYRVKIDKNGYLDGFEHPEEVKECILRKVFRTRYDEELNTFQLRLDRWDIFKELFETVTGYSVEKIEHETSPFTVRDPSLYRQTAMLEQYVLQLKITKPNEIITDRECSKGEKKVLKNFTTLLNKDYVPSVILIDDVEMHVELDRHIDLIECIERCFPGSQTIFTTHSPKIIYGFDLERLQDLTIKTNFVNDTWRKSLVRLMCQLSFFETDVKLIEKSKSILNDLRTNKDLDMDVVKKEILDFAEKTNKNKIGAIDKV